MLRATGSGQAIEQEISRLELIQRLNEDLSREYQAIIGYGVYSQVIKDAAFMNVARQLEERASQELEHALVICKQIDYLGGVPAVNPQAVKVSEKADEMLRFDLDNENSKIRNYRERIQQCERLGEYAIAQQIREILVNEQEHRIVLAKVLGEEVPDVMNQE